MQVTISLVSMLYKGVIGALVAGLVALVAWPFKKLSAIHSELITQRTNCLQTLTVDGKEQVILLGKVANTLEAMHLDQARLLGRIEK